eukprot:12329767-Alexandrium_andersonii.AAC.1
MIRAKPDFAEQRVPKIKVVKSTAAGVGGRLARSSCFSSVPRDHTCFALAGAASSSGLWTMSANNVWLVGMAWL